MRTYRDYTDDDVINYAKDVKSIAGLLRALGLKVAGGNYDSIKRQLHRLKVDTEHWTGSAWSKDEQTKDWSQYKKCVPLKKILIKERGLVCESCSNTEWMGKPIPIELEHIDGDRTNNAKNNLKLLCCNCHALTPTWRGRKLKGVKNPSITRVDKTCKDCGRGVSRRSIRCRGCNLKTYSTTRTLKFDPTYEELYHKVVVEQLPLTKIGIIFGVSDNTVRKRCKKFGIDPKHVKIKLT
jgi:hypothetical protein